MLIGTRKIDLVGLKKQAWGRCLC